MHKQTIQLLAVAAISLLGAGCATVDPRSVAQTGHDTQAPYSLPAGENAAFKKTLCAGRRTVAVRAVPSAAAGSRVALPSAAPKLSAGTKAALDALGFVRAVPAEGAVAAFLDGGCKGPVPAGMPDFAVFCNAVRVSSAKEEEASAPAPGMPARVPGRRVTLAARFALYDRFEGRVRSVRTVSEESGGVDPADVPFEAERLLGKAARDYVDGIAGELGPVGVVLKTTGNGRYAYVSLGRDAGLAAGGHVRFYRLEDAPPADCEPDVSPDGFDADFGPETTSGDADEEEGDGASDAGVGFPAIPVSEPAAPAAAEPPAKPPAAPVGKTPTPATAVEEDWIDDDDDAPAAGGDDESPAAAPAGKTAPADEATDDEDDWVDAGDLLRNPGPGTPRVCLVAKADKAADKTKPGKTKTAKTPVPVESKAAKIRSKTKTERAPAETKAGKPSVAADGPAKARPVRFRLESAAEGRVVDSVPPEANRAWIEVDNYNPAAPCVRRGMPVRIVPAPVRTDVFSRLTKELGL